MPDNWSRIGSGFYIVRTQAGFKQAALAYLGGKDSPDNRKLVAEIQGYPLTYPAVCCFRMPYAGYHYLAANSCSG